MEFNGFTGRMHRNVVKKYLQKKLNQPSLLLWRQHSCSIYIPSGENQQSGRVEGNCPENFPNISHQMIFQNSDTETALQLFPRDYHRGLWEFSLL